MSDPAFQQRRDDIAVRFLDRNNEQVNFNDQNEKREIVGFQIFLRKRKRVKTFFRHFKAAEFMSYMEDWEDWPEMNGAELAKIESLFKK